MNERSNDDYKKYYNTMDVIGSGGFGTVFKGMEKGTNELRAIKIIELDKIKENIMASGEDVEIKFKEYIEILKKEYENML